MGVSSVGSTAGVHGAIEIASRKTGIDFDYLLGQAKVESGLRPNARAGTSSATGLYQFIEQSWLGVVKEHGAEHGMGWAADAIKVTSSGRYVVADPAARRAILNLRNDPHAASIMAAEHAADNKAALEQTLGRPATGTDLYMAHFLGLGGARSFLTQMEANPGRSGASLFPAAARANRNIFYTPNGQPRSLTEIYQRFGAKLGDGAGTLQGAPGALPAGMDESGMPDLAAEWETLLAGGGEVILGTEATRGEQTWVHTTLANINSLREPINPMRPTPETAKLAYLMLASMGA